MKKFMTVLTGVAFSLSLVSITAFAGEKPGAEHMIAGGQNKKPAVAFDHTAHEERAEKDCQTCHHKDEKDAERGCTTTEGCHGKDNAKMTKKLHKRCKDDCHKKDKKGPTKCGDCHKK